MRFVATLAALGLLLAAAGTAGANTLVKLGTATGGIMIYYNNLDVSGAQGVQDGVISGYDEDPSNQAYIRAQLSYGNTDGMAFQFDTADLGGGVSWNDIFSGQPAGQSQYGLDIIALAPTYDSAGGVTLPDFNFADATAPYTATYTDAFPENPMAWAINDYKGGSADGPGQGGVPVNSLLRGTAMTMTGTVTPSSDGTWTLELQGTLVSDGYIHWYNPALGSTDLTSWMLGDTLYYSGTLTYDSSGDDGSDQMDFYAGSIDVYAEVIPEPVTLAGLGLGVGSLATYLRRRRK